MKQVHTAMAAAEIKNLSPFVIPPVLFEPQWNYTEFASKGRVFV
jgi:hypothetical protein